MSLFDLAAGASRVFCFRCDCDADMAKPAKGLLDVHNRSFHIAIKQAYHASLAHLSGSVDA